jgi:hypothetical protein
MNKGGNDDAVEDLPVPPARLFERLARIRGYVWDQSIQPFHSVRHSSFFVDIELADSDFIELRQLACIRYPTVRRQLQLLCHK